MITSGLSILIFIALVLVVLIAYYINRKNDTTHTPPGPPPSDEKPAQTVWTQIETGAWSTTENGYKLAVSNLPPNVTPQIIALDSQALLQEPRQPENLEIISIVADVQFFDADNKLVVDFDRDVSLSMGITAQEKDALHKLDRPLTDLAVIQYNVAQGEIWKRLPDSMIDFSHISDSVDPRVIITFTCWGDPPTGYGTPPNPR